MPPTSAWWARLATHPTSRPPAWQGATRVTSLRWVPPAKGSLSTTWSPGRRSRPAPMAAATDAGMLPRCTGMCSAWTSSSPAAVNTAAEQSARSLMLGERADRRSTSPISVATPVSWEISTCSAAGIHRQSGMPSSDSAPSAATNPTGGRPPASRAPPRWCSPARRATAGPATGPCRSGGGQSAARSTGEGQRAEARRATTSTGRPSAGNRCAGRARPRSGHRGTVSSWLWPA